MKTSITTITAAIALTALMALMAGPASAMVSKAGVTQNVNSAIGPGSNVFVNIDENVATFTGYFDNATDKYSAIQAAKANVGIDRVIDLTTVSN